MSAKKRVGRNRVVKLYFVINFNILQCFLIIFVRFLLLSIPTNMIKCNMNFKTYKLNKNKHSKYLIHILVKESQELFTFDL